VCAVRVAGKSERHGVDGAISADVTLHRDSWKENVMSIKMPEPNQAVLVRRDSIVTALRAIVPGEGVIDSAAEIFASRSETATVRHR
jgi:hypothetical protein